MKTVYTATEDGAGIIRPGRKNRMRPGQTIRLNGRHWAFRFDGIQPSLFGPDEVHFTLISPGRPVNGSVVHAPMTATEHDLLQCAGAAFQRLAA